MSARTVCYKGMLLAHHDRRILQGSPGRPAWIGARVGPPALLDEYISVVGLAHPVPPHLPQRRDNTCAACQLDPARAKGENLEPRSPAATWEKIWPLIYDGQSELGFVRQRARASGHGRLFRSHTRIDDDESPSLGEPTLMDPTRRAFYSTTPP